MSLSRKKDDETFYRVYVTDTLKLIAENTAKFAQGSFIPKRYIDAIRKADTAPTAAAVKAKIKKKFRFGG